jgi:hypothetical protein
MVVAFRGRGVVCRRHKSQPAWFWERRPLAESRWLHRFIRVPARRLRLIGPIRRALCLPARRASREATAVTQSAVALCALSPSLVTRPEPQLPATSLEPKPTRGPLICSLLKLCVGSRLRLCFATLRLHSTNARRASKSRPPTANRPAPHEPRFPSPRVHTEAVSEVAKMASRKKVLLKVRATQHALQRRYIRCLSHLTDETSASRLSSWATAVSARPV